MLLKGHLALLCQAHEIKQVLRPRRGNRPACREIQPPLGASLKGYFVALRDIARIVNEPGENRLERDAAAWEWALENSIARPDVEVRQMICALLWRDLVRARHNAWPLPADDSTYWTLVGLSRTGR